MSRIFISYRRFDSAGYAGRLYDRLSQHFGDNNIFMDIDTIEPGLDIVEVIEESVGSCDVLIALIGRRWLSITDTSGQRRLDNPEDFVRLEIATALDRNIRVIPVLVQGAAMPQSSDLPDELKKLARRNALPIGDRFHPDVDRLIEVIEKVLSAPLSASPKPKTEQRTKRPPPSPPKPKEAVILPQPEKELKKPAPTPALAAQPRSTNWLLLGGVAGGLLLVIILGSIIFSAIGGRDDEPSPSLAEAANIPTAMLSSTNTPEPPTSTPTPESTLTPVVLPTYTPPSGPLRQIIIASDGSPMVLIPAGPFTMGGDSGDPAEQPVHEVTLDTFYIDQYEVTNARYADCVAAGDCNLPGCTESYNDPDKVNHPVVCVNWEQANTYCEWRKGRLPTEAEWEKATRGTDGRNYPWGNQWDDTKLNNSVGGPGDTTPVGQYSPDGDSPYGAADMAGNVWEWVADWYEGPDDGTKVLRGGSWSYGDNYARSALRSIVRAVYHNVHGGFRCVAAAPE